MKSPAQRPRLAGAPPARRPRPTTATAEPAPWSEDLVRTICHDLRGPLAAIVMGSSFLARQMPQDESTKRARKMADAILRAAERMSGVLADFQDLAQIEGKRLTLDLHPHDAMALLVSAAGSPRELAVRVDVLPLAKPVLVRCDRACVLRVLDKLVRNAANASPPNARITLGAERAGGAVVFRVKDAGRGIDDDVLPHLFDYRWLATRRARQGLGIGIGVAKGLVEAHGGELSLESTGAEGTTFAFTLPRA